jgi:hypothetical protein
MVHYLPKTGRLLHPHIGWEVSEARGLASVPLLSISVKYRKIATVGGLVSLSGSSSSGGRRTTRRPKKEMFQSVDCQLSRTQKPWNTI